MRALFATLALTAAALALPARADQALFADDEPLVLTLRAPLKSIDGQRRREERDYQPAVLVTTNADGAEVEIDAELRARGNFRREHCTQPPLRLRLAKDGRKHTPFAGQRRLKLVRPCKKSSSYQQLIHQELLVYRTYNILTDASFRVRPARMTFVDTDRKNKSHEAIVFFIEDRDRMARRLERVVADQHQVDYGLLDARQAALVEVFMFMIGGHDWSILTGPPGEMCCHNARLLIDPEGGKPILPVPYDFDFSGIIDAPYASPPEQLPIKSVTKRYFRGRCKSAELWAETFAHFRARREDVLALYRNDPWLSDRTRERALDYLAEFYAIIDDAERTQRHLIDRCIG